MKALVEYHLVVHALESRAHWNGNTRFAAAIGSVLCGLLPYSRFLAAGQMQQREGMTETAIEAKVNDLSATDLNPAAQIISNLTQPQNAVWALNAYTGLIGVGVRTRLEGVAASQGHFKLNMHRELLQSDEDPQPCSTSAFAVMEGIVNAVQNKTQHLRDLRSVAVHLGVENSAAAELANIFSVEGEMPIGLAINRLGCNRRTLERNLQKDGLSVDMLRRASRLLRATQRLRSDDSLTTIAAEEGFSDLAHMSRAFRHACGVTPSVLRLAALGGVTPEPRPIITSAQNFMHRLPA